MSDPLKMVNELAVRAREEEVPAVDISSAVVSRLSREMPPSIWPLAVFASSATVCAAIILIISLPLFEMVTDPLSAVFIAAAEILQ